MSDFLGSDFQIAIQKRLQTNNDWIKASPDFSNGGRVLNVLEPQNVGWPRIVEPAKQDNCISLTAQSLAPTLPLIRQYFDSDWDTPYWDVFLGTAQTTTAASKSILDSVPLPTGWALETYTRPTDEQITRVQMLNLETGIGPSPAWYMRGDAFPTLIAAIKDTSGELVATAMGNLRYHPQSRFADHLFQGSVSVHPAHRGKRLGNFVSAAVFFHSQTEFKWKTALSQVSPQNAPSRRMIEACGLTSKNGLATIGIIQAGQKLTR